MLPSLPIDVLRTDLRADVCSLIGLVCHGHVEGELRVPVEGLLTLLGLQVAPEFHEQLVERGDLHFSGGQFANDGDPIRRGVRMLGMGAELQIAPNLRGRLERAADRFSLQFEAGSSFRVGRGPFDLELHRLDVTDARVSLGFRPALQVRVRLVEGG